MPAEEAGDLDAGFEQGRSGRVFRVRFLPTRVTTRGGVLFVHAFGEEMNRSRHVVALTARRLAAEGLVVDVVDLYGCGDSEGTLAEATVEGWLDDLEDRARALVSRVSGPLHLWGMRAGALLAAALAQRLEDLQGEDSRVLLWQPAIRGRQVLRDFLRLRTAAALMGAGPRETVDDLRARLDRGETLEVAGHPLAPPLAAGLELLSLSAMRPGRRTIHWLHISADGQQASPGPADAVVQAWREQGGVVHTIPVAGPAFWSAAELEDCPALVEATLSALSPARLASAPS